MQHSSSSLLFLHNISFQFLFCTLSRTVSTGRESRGTTYIQYTADKRASTISDIADSCCNQADGRENYFLPLEFHLSLARVKHEREMNI